MKFALAALMAVAASASPFAPKTKNSSKSKYVSNLLRKAKTLRKLNDDYPVDISSYSVKFEKCQFVRSYNDEMAENEEAPTVLGTTRFAIFRLCPDDCESCQYNYGEYLLDLDIYLELAVEYFQEYQNDMCDSCDQWCGNNNNRKLNEVQPDDLDCDVCVDECEKIENMEENGFVDATEFLECQEIYDDGNDNGVAYYAAPICTSDGDKINIGVFSDELCQNYQEGLNVEDYLDQDDGVARSLSHALLKMTYHETCISCLEVDENQNNNNNNNNGDEDNGNDQQDADEVIDLCENLYDFSAKCEFSHGFETGYYGVYGYENQWAQEDTVCDYIQSLKSGTYDESGEINIQGASFSIGGGNTITGGQKFALCFFVLGTVGLAVYAAMLHSKLTKGGASTVEAGTGALA